MPHTNDLDPISQQMAAMLATLEPDCRLDTTPTGYRRSVSLKVDQNPRLIAYMLEPHRAWIESGQARLTISRFTPAVVQITLTDISEIAWSARQEDTKQ